MDCAGTLLQPSVPAPVFRCLSHLTRQLPHPYLRGRERSPPQYGKALSSSFVSFLWANGWQSYQLFLFIQFFLTCYKSNYSKLRKPLSLIFPPHWKCFGSYLLLQRKESSFLCFTIIMFNRKQMSASPQTSQRKPLKNITQQENNYNLHNHLTIAPTSTRSNAIPRKTSLKTNNSDTKVARKIFESQQERESGDKGGRYYQMFERNSEEIERQVQNCQNYFLRKTIMALYKLFEKSQQRWDLYGLNYSQLLKIMHWLGYIRSQGNEGMSKKVSEDLKKCYWIWVNLIQGKTFSLSNLIIILCCIEHIEYDEQLIEDIVRELSKGIDKFEAVGPMEDSKYIFFVKNERFPFSDGGIKLQRNEIEKVQAYLKDLRYNKLMESHPHSQLEKQEEPNYISLSKKTEILAQNKRIKMSNEIRMKEPSVQEIELHHLLSYKASHAKERTLKTEQFQQQPQSKQRKTKELKKINANPAQYLIEQSNKKKKIVPSSKPIDKTKNNAKKPQKTQKQRRNPNQAEERYEDFPLLQSSKSSELFASHQDKPQKKQQIIDELQWQQIPKPLSEVKMQTELLQFKDNFHLQPPISHHFCNPPEESQNRERKRKEFLDLPILFVDVNIEQGRKERIVIYEGDLASDLANEFGKKYGLTSQMIERLQALLQLQIGSILTKIDQANEQDCSELY